MEGHPVVALNRAARVSERFRDGTESRGHALAIGEPEPEDVDNTLSAIPFCIRAGCRRPIRPGQGRRRAPGGSGKLDWKGIAFPDCRTGASICP